MHELLTGLGFLLGGALGALLCSRHLTRAESGQRLLPMAILLVAIPALAIGVIHLAALAGALPTGSQTEKLLGGLFIAALGLVGGVWLRRWLIEPLQRQRNNIAHAMRDATPLRITYRLPRPQAVIFVPLVAGVFVCGLVIATLAALRLEGSPAAIATAAATEAWFSAHFMALALVIWGIAFIAWHGERVISAWCNGFILVKDDVFTRPEGPFWYWFAASAFCAGLGGFWIYAALRMLS